MNCMTQRNTHARWYSSFFIATLITLTGCDNKSEKPNIPVTTVTAITIAPQDIPVDFPFVARVESSQNVDIHARVSGYLDSKNYTEGGKVSKNQVLFKLDQRPFQAALDAARAQLANNQAALNTAQLTLNRYNELTPRGAASQADLDNAIGTFQQAKASVSQAKANVTQAELNLSYTVITSPVDGISGMAIPSVGTYIDASNSKMTTVATLSPMWINFSVSENQRQSQTEAIKKGLLRAPANGIYEAEILLGNNQVYAQRGKLTFASPFYNSNTGTFMVRASVDNPNGALLPNQYVNVVLKGAVRPNAILLPQRAVQQGAGTNYVWVVGKNSQAEYRPVTTGQWRGLGWFVNSGLNAGEQVIVDGVTTLRPEAPLKVTPLSAAEMNKSLGLTQTNDAPSAAKK
ncbi:efflux RND transporter periplasmic adaptor subunit [Deefgea piscis]|uniref:efflux RND transporter periplasmic adaptor subunit n=1 Tax=Deefgea piscis TaxID=2739061 RepID=UPI001C7EAE70|nr:efflux RND transporter periplasmic adaptor subunit [Deefgea piscis]QZA82153.1 efflux RND transporter periplasmic adaptor subunit [Deefgea piscis]